MHHPAATPAPEVVEALDVGTVLFVGSSAFAYWRTNRRVLLTRLVVLAATVAVPAAVSSAAPAFQLATVVAGLLVVALTERHGPAGAGAGGLDADGDLPLAP